MTVRVAQAARNNAAWCDAVFRAHGTAGEFFPSHWLNRAPAPPYYPNLVTLDSAVAPALAAVREIEQARPSASWALKDSFAVLALEPQGFKLLFRAEWIARPAALAPRSPRTRWIRVESELALSAWESAWGGSAGQARIFRPALLRRAEVAFLAALDEGGAIRAGVIAHRSENAVGLTNFFAYPGETREHRARCVEAAASVFPGLPLVGYESGEDLAESLDLGFSPLGSLQVWQLGAV